MNERLQRRFDIKMKMLIGPRVMKLQLDQWSTLHRNSIRKELHTICGVSVFKQASTMNFYAIFHHWFWSEELENKITSFGTTFPTYNNRHISVQRKFKLYSCLVKPKVIYWSLGMLLTISLQIQSISTMPSIFL
jgi:hypothetical protein